MILEGEIKDAKMTSFSSDFQTLIKHNFFFIFSLYIINEYESFNSRLFPSFNLEMIFTHFRERRARHQGIVRGMGCQLENKHTIWYQIFFPIRSDRPKMGQNLKTERKLQK